MSRDQELVCKGCDIRFVGTFGEDEYCKRCKEEIDAMSKVNGTGR